MSLLKFWKDKFPTLSELPTLMLRKLVKAYDSGEENRSGQRVSEVGMLLYDLIQMAAEGHLQEIPGKPGNYEMKGENPYWYENCKTAIGEMEQRGWVRLIGSGTDTKVMPTVNGLDHGRFLNRSWWYRRLVHPFSGNFRTLIIGAVSGAGAAILAAFVMKLLGWIG